MRGGEQFSLLRLFLRIFWGVFPSFIKFSFSYPMNFLSFALSVLYSSSDQFFRSVKPF